MNHFGLVSINVINNHSQAKNVSAGQCMNLVVPIGSYLLFLNECTTAKITS